MNDEQLAYIRMLASGMNDVPARFVIEIVDELMAERNAGRELQARVAGMRNHIQEIHEANKKMAFMIAKRNVVIMQLRNGVSPDEIDWTGIDG